MRFVLDNPHRRRYQKTSTVLRKTIPFPPGRGKGVCKLKRHDKSSSESIGCQRMEPARNETTREPNVFLGVDGVFVGGPRSAIQRHPSARSHGHGGENMPPATCVFL